jgi:predicted Rossmann fold nucleotide-binding protein DprA/Smf involved in DNA uptake
MNWSKTVQRKQDVQVNMTKLAEFTREEQEIVQALRFFQKEIHIDELSEQAQLSPVQLSSILLKLELKHVVQFLPGNKLKLVNF